MLLKDTLRLAIIWWIKSFKERAKSHFGICRRRINRGAAWPENTDRDHSHVFPIYIYMWSTHHVWKDNTHDYRRRVVRARRRLCRFIYESRTSHRKGKLRSKASPVVRVVVVKHVAVYSLYILCKRLRIFHLYILYIENHLWIE